ncbi:HAD family hydrolase [Streptomyces sp. BK340]|uniref:HAD-IIIC family phosphatase n=1 Tax=Streptomyces sp. BK340 TaxID=2572903 RepID=UPI0011A543D6|nr:HAD-IIIC family phosphatase [Streptomyces sp. BK340]TVZ75512.1 D-glyceryl-ACP synthase [Streptomyces sp. BK340]
MTSAADLAWERVRLLRDTGQLATAYAEIGALADSLPEHRQAALGQLLLGLDPHDVTASDPAVTTLDVVITGNGTTAPLRAPLAAAFARNRLLLRPQGQGQYINDLGDPGSEVYCGQTDLTVCLLDPDLITAELAAVWTPTDCERVLRSVGDRIRALAAEHDRAGSGTLVLTTVPLPAWLAKQLVDFQSRAGLGLIWREFNAALLRLTAELPRCVVVDLDVLLTAPVALDEPRLRVYTQVGYSEGLLHRIADEIATVARVLRGQTKKVLVLDLDGTLWGGVLGDDGVTGVQIGHAGPGDAFRRFQRTVAQLGSQGVLLSVCSKNDEQLVRTALAERAEMVLREEDFVAIVANWEPKDRGIAGLTEALNLGLDSVVFVDDSAFECGLVRDHLPKVAVVEVGSEPARHAEQLLAGDWFAALRLTGEDRARRDAYRAEAERDSFRSASSSLKEYLESLDTRVEIFRPDEQDLARIAQLTQRTNQFNMTTARMDLAQVRAALSEPGSDVWAVRCGDRFGEAGIVGVVFHRITDDQLHIDNMLLSCRVFGRGLESAIVREVLTHAVELGVDRVVARYRPTPKNGRFARFYEEHGFVTAEPDSDTATWVRGLAELPSPLTHLTVTNLQRRATK